MKAKFRPTQALGPYENGLNALCIASSSLSNHLSGLNTEASSPHLHVSVNRIGWHTQDRPEVLVPAKIHIVLAAAISRAVIL